MSKKAVLSSQDLARAAQALQTDVPAVRAVCQVEAPRGGFLSTGEVTILFERHKFSVFTGRKWDATHPDISSRKRGGYSGGLAEHRRLQRAVSLDRDAALRATSWGKFQILGENYAQCGFASLQDFINAMHAGEPEQLDAFVQFIRVDPRLHRALRAHDWAVFASIYNGPAFDSAPGRDDDYDTRLAAAFRQFGGR